MPTQVEAGKTDDAHFKVVVRENPLAAAVPGEKSRALNNDLGQRHFI
jgi:hypothetical protein